jgi:hypothetical protein
MSCRSLRPQAADGASVSGDEDVGAAASVDTWAFRLWEGDVGPSPGQMGGRGRMSWCVAGSLAD